MADINSLSFGCGNTLLANQLNIMADAIRSLITLVGTIGDKVGSYIPLSGSEDITGVLAPDTNEGHNLGKSNKRWGTVWASVGGFKVIDFYDLQSPYGKLGRLEINQDGKLQYDGEPLALLSDINNEINSDNQSFIHFGQNVRGRLDENYVRIPTSLKLDDVDDNEEAISNNYYNLYCGGINIKGTKFIQKGNRRFEEDDGEEHHTLCVRDGELLFDGNPIGSNPQLGNVLEGINELDLPESSKYLYYNYDNLSFEWANGTGTSGGGGSIDWGTNSAPNGTLPHIILDGDSKIHANELSGKMLSIYNKNTANDEYSGLWTITIQNNELCYGNLQITKNNGTELNTSNSPGVSYLSSDKGKYLKVKNDGTGTEWSNISLSDLSNTKIGESNNALSDGLVLVYDSSSTKWKNTSLPANLPNTSTDNNGQYLTVENGIAKWVSVTPGSGLLWSDLTNNNTTNIIHSGNLPKASSSALGIVKGDGLTVSINSSGEISVSGTLAGLNVESGTPSNGDILVYRTSSNEWKKESLPTGNLPSGGINGDHLIMGNNGPEWETSYNIYLVENGNKTLNGTITPQSTSKGGGIFIGTNKSGSIYSNLANPIILSPGTGGVQIASSGTGNNYSSSTIKTSNDGNLILKSSVDTIIDTELGTQYIYLNGSRIYLSTDKSENGHYLSLNSNNLLCYDGNVIGSGGGLTAATAGGEDVVSGTTVSIPKASSDHYGVIKLGNVSTANCYPVKLADDVAYVEVPPTSLTSVTWNNVTGKPSWIGNSKPSYTASEVGALPSDTKWGLRIDGNDLYISKGSGSTSVTLPTGGSSSETFFFLFISLLKNRYNSKMIITQTQNSSHTAVTSIGLITEPTFIEEDVIYMLKGYFQSGGLYFIHPLFRFSKNNGNYYLLVIVDNVSDPSMVYCCVDGFNDDDAVHGYGTDSRTIPNPKDVVYNISRYMINLLQTKYNITVSNSSSGSTASDYMYSYSSNIQNKTTSSIKYYIEPNATSGQYNYINVSI